MNVIIVGNGPSLLEKENGQLIDSFDVVVRFNSFTTTNYEKHTGVKTDYWFNTINIQNKANAPQTQIVYKRVYWHSWMWNPEKDNGWNSFVEFYKNTSVELIKTQRETVVEMQQYMQNRTYFTYSTGAIAIWLMLKEHQQVTITGFDWWNQSENHHYNDKAPRGTIHKPELELLFVNRLMNENKLKFL